LRQAHGQPHPTHSTDVALERLAIGLLVLLFAVVAALTPAQNDTFWQLRVGEDIWHTGDLTSVDAYSHTAAGRTWGNHEWLSQVAMFLLWRAGGMPGLAAGALVLILAAVVVTYFVMVGPRMTRFVLMGAGISVSSSVWVLRPQLVSLLGIALLLALLVIERHRWIPVLFVLWANAHGGVALGGLMLVGAAVAAVVRWRLDSSGGAGGSERAQRANASRLQLMAVVLLLSALATTLTPLGPGIFQFVLESGTRFSVHITEWAPPVPWTGLGAMFWVLAAGFVAALVARRRALRSASFADLACVAAALALLPLAVRSLRNIGPFLMVATVATSRVLGPDFRFRLPARWRTSLEATARPRAPSRALPVNLVLAGLGVAASIAVGLAWLRPLPVLNWRPIADGALAAVHACPGPLYNRYDEGGYLIWFAPQQPVFVDGRQDPYPLEFLNEVVKVEDGGSHRELFERWGIRCAFLPADAELGARLRAEGWKVSFADPRWTVLVKPDPSAPSARGRS
jgi:hypothetical protein